MTIYNVLQIFEDYTSIRSFKKEDDARKFMDNIKKSYCQEFGKKFKDFGEIKEETGDITELIETELE